MSEISGRMITYCTNIHPGESWGDTFKNLQTYIPPVAASVSPVAPFPIGLRLSGRASLEIDERASAEFTEWLQRTNTFVPTLNGFPHGSFHRSAVKENVYLPDWRDGERVAYTVRLANLLDSWLPDGVQGSISTVPVGFKRGFRDEGAAVRANLMFVLEHLDRLRQKSGKTILLALEPEPGCLLETTYEVVEFFDRMAFPDELRRGIGICFDCCHQAVEFETPSHSLKLLADAGIAVAKLQVSSALRVKNPDRALMEKFCEPCYLHQVVIRDEAGVLSRYSDLPDALREHRAGHGDEWRIHFHVPIFVDRLAPFESTGYFITETLPLIAANVLLEVETYTWEVLPPELRMASVTQSIIREIEWLKAERNETNCCS
jgi:sugar phosphate isomerase/epimerase